MSGKRRPWRVAVLLGSFALVSCIPYKEEVWKRTPVAQEEVAAKSTTKLKVGDLVRVRTKQDKVHLFHIKKLDDAGFLGLAKNNKTYRVDYANLYAIEVKRKQWDYIVLGFTLGSPRFP